MGTHPSEEARAKMCVAQVGRVHRWGYHLSEETRRKLSIARIGNKNNLGNKASDETRAKMSAVHSGSNNAFYGRTHIEATKEAIRQSRIGKPTTLGCKASVETRLRISQNRKGISGKSATRSQTYLELWQDPEWAAKRVQKIVASRHSRPNKVEMVLSELLDKHFPDEWRYVGDGSFTIGRLNPDFINVNGKKQVIELFGTYWHKPEEEQVRIDIFADFGFSTIIIWESELADLDAVVSRVKRFKELKHRTSQSRASKSNNALGKRRDFTRSIPLLGDKEKVQS